MVPQDSPRAVLAAIGRRHARRLALTYGMLAFETVCDTLYPAVIGLAIDGLLRGQPWEMAPLVMVWTAHLAVGLTRHVFETKTFTRVYTDFAGDMVARQRAGGMAEPVVVARVVLSREIVDFFRHDLPGVLVACVRLGGAVMLLAFYDGWLGAAALAAACVIAAINARFARAADRLNAALNNRLEQEVGIVAASPVVQVRRHFARVAFWRVRISTAEAWTWGAVEVVVIVLTLCVLLRLTALPGISPGAIYAVLAYVWTFYDGVNTLPDLVQRAARLRDIAARLAAG